MTEAPTDARTMPRDDYRTARTDMLADAKRHQVQREPAPEVDAMALDRRDYAAARQAMLRSAA